MTELSHNLTDVKTIFSVCAQRQHLFVLDKMILTLIIILVSARSISTTTPTVRCRVFFPRKQYTTNLLLNRRYPSVFIPICADALAAEWRLL